MSSVLNNRAWKTHPIQVIPLGGVGHMGMNGMLIGHRGRFVLVDCGVRFLAPGDVGYERCMADLGFLKAMAGEIEAVVLTHGHEDHIGALPWVLKVLDPAVTVHATGYTRALTRRRLMEYGGWSEDRVQVYSPRAPFAAGPFQVEGIRVTHSIPDCCSVVLRCDDGTVLHTGDWKIDRDPMDGEHFDQEAFEALGREGCSLMMGDSTNARVPGHTLGERPVAEAIRTRIEAHDGRVVIAQFASNLHRLQGVVEAAEATGRRICLVGRSLTSYLEAAQELGRAPLDPGKVVVPDAMKDIPDHKLIVVCTGSQGESRAALGRAARGEHPVFKVGPGDLVLHSARIIPGHDPGVHQMFNALARRGAQLVYGRGTGIHASGHAKQEELSQLLRWVRPQAFVPIHGEYTFLQAHAGLAADVPGVQTRIFEDGDVFGLSGRGGGAELLGHQDLNTWYHDDVALGDEEEMALNERKRLAWNGVAVVRLKGRGAAPDDVQVEILGMWRGAEDLHEAIAEAVVAALAEIPAMTPVKERREMVRVVTRRVVRKAVGKRPEVVIVWDAVVAHD